MATKPKYKVGDRVQVTSLMKLSSYDPTMQPYLGKEGVIVLQLPAEWNLPVMYRVDFDDKSLPSLAFIAKELKRL